MLRFPRFRKRIDEGKSEEELAQAIASYDDSVLARLAIEFIEHARIQIATKQVPELDARIDQGIQEAKWFMDGDVTVDSIDSAISLLKTNREGIEWVLCPAGAIVAEALQSVLKLVKVQHDHSKSSEIIAHSTILAAQVSRDAVGGGLVGGTYDMRRGIERDWQRTRWLAAIDVARKNAIIYTFPTGRSRRSLLAS